MGCSVEEVTRRYLSAAMAMAISIKIDVEFATDLRLQNAILPAVYVEVWSPRQIEERLRSFI